MNSFERKELWSFWNIVCSWFQRERSFWEIRLFLLLYSSVIVQALHIIVEKLPKWMTWLGWKVRKRCRTCSFDDNVNDYSYKQVKKRIKRICERSKVEWYYSTQMLNFLWSTCDVMNGRPLYKRLIFTCCQITNSESIYIKKNPFFKNLFFHRETYKKVFEKDWESVFCKEVVFLLKMGCF